MPPRGARYQADERQRHAPRRSRRAVRRRAARARRRPAPRRARRRRTGRTGRRRRPLPANRMTVTSAPARRRCAAPGEAGVRWRALRPRPWWGRSTRAGARRERCRDDPLGKRRRQVARRRGERGFPGATAISTARRAGVSRRAKPCQVAVIAVAMTSAEAPAGVARPAELPAVEARGHAGAAEIRPELRERVGERRGGEAAARSVGWRSRSRRNCRRMRRPATPVARPRAAAPEPSADRLASLRGFVVEAVEAAAGGRHRAGTIQHPRLLSKHEEVRAFPPRAHDGARAPPHGLSMVRPIVRSGCLRTSGLGVRARDYQRGRRACQCRGRATSAVACVAVVRA